MGRNARKEKLKSVRGVCWITAIEQGKKWGGGVHWIQEYK